MKKGSFVLIKHKEVDRYGIITSIQDGMIIVLLFGENISYQFHPSEVLAYGNVSWVERII